MNGPVTLDSMQKLVATGAKENFSAQRQAQLSPMQQKLLANWQAAKERCEVNRQLGEWLIDLRSRIADNERHFTLVDCSLTPDDLVREVERIRLALILNARRGR
jgi:hypothetical protein